MLAGRWSENLKIQQIKRTLVIQYWILKGGEKSWVEIGVRRGDKKRPSKLGVRWIREGREVKDEEVPLDTAVLSAEMLMKTVIAMHTKNILTSIRDKLAMTPLFATPGSLSLVTHKSDSFESRLKVQLTSSRKCKVLIEPITGRFALQRPSKRSMQVESTMNSRPNTAQDMIVQYKFVTMQDTLRQRARSMDWEILETIAIRREELKKWFPLTTQYMTYMRKKGWSRNWLLVVTFDDTGDKWWVAEM
jgi:mediator of RNA polymerase II transcription subunit 14